MRKRYEYIYMYKARREDTGTLEIGEVIVPFKINKLVYWDDISYELSERNGYDISIFDMQLMRKRRVA